MNQIQRADLQLAGHSFSTHDVMISSEVDESNITDPKMWVNVAYKLKAGDQIRVVGDDYSFVSTLFVSFVQGSNVRLKVISFTKFESHIDDEQIERLKVKSHGPKGFSIFDTVDNKTVREGIPTKKEAYNELELYIKAINL